MQKEKIHKGKKESQCYHPGTESSVPMAAQVHLPSTKQATYMARTMEDKRHPMEETEGSAGKRKGFETENADEWTKSRQKNIKGRRKSSI